MVEVLWERHIGSVMFYLLDMAHKRRQACPSVVVKEKQWSFSEKGPLGYGRTLIVYAGSGPPCHSTSTYDGPGGVFTIAILKNHDQPFYNEYKNVACSFRMFERPCLPHSDCLRELA